MADEKPLEVAHRILDTSRVPKHEIVYVRPGGWMKALVLLCFVVSLVMLLSLGYLAGNRKVARGNGDKLDRNQRITCQIFTEFNRVLPPECATGK